MPTPFLVTVYILMYYLGVQAANGRSLERPLTQQLDISPLSLVCHVVMPLAILILVVVIRLVGQMRPQSFSKAMASSIQVQLKNIFYS